MDIHCSHDLWKTARQFVNRTARTITCCLILLGTAPFQVVLADIAAPHSSSIHCPAFHTSPLFRAPTKTTIANPSNWIQAIKNSVDGEEILLENGHYLLNQPGLPIRSTITIRSVSGDKNSVVIQGKAPGEVGNGLVVYADDVQIADITIRDIWHNAISIQEGFSQTVIYNVNTLDIGTHHIKSNRGGPGGVVACSRLGYTQPTAIGDYMGGIDLHKAIDWTIRDNYFYNIHGDGSGCIVDTECGTKWPGGDAAILIWRDSHDNTIERNTIVESYRAISLGLDSPYSGGTVTDNVICRSQPGKEGVNGFIDGDTGISLLGADKVVVKGNSVILAGNYPGPVELKDATGIVIEDNVLSKPVWNRGNAEYNGCDSENCNDQEFGNTTDADTSTISCPAYESIAVASSTDISSGLTALDNDIHTPPDNGRQLKEERLLLIEERLLAVNERIKIKNERLNFLNEKLILEIRFQALENELLKTQLKLESTLRQLESHEH